MDYQEALRTVEKANAQIVEANGIVWDVIRTVYIYHWNWYVGLAMIVIPWVLWALFRKKDSSGRLLTAGLFIMIFSAVFDTLGIENGLWSYPVKTVPSPTLSFSYRLSVLPVLAMFFIQVKPGFHPFLKAVVFAGLSAYVGLPLMTWMDMYKKIHWSYTYSFFILTAMYLVAYWLTRLESYNQLRDDSGGMDKELTIPWPRRKEKA